MGNKWIGSAGPQAATTGEGRIRPRRWIAGLPPELIGRVGAVLGLILYALDRSHRRIVFDNLRFAYPQWTHTRIRRTARDVYRNLGRTLVEIVQLSCWSPEDLRERVQVEGQAHLESAVEQGRGIVVVSAHIGNWEVALAYAGCFLRLPLTAIVKRMRFRPLDRWLNRQRRRFGTTIRYKQRALPQMMAVIRNREALTVLIDQSKRSEGVPVSFFGAQATATTVAALLARRYRSPILPVFCVRTTEGRLTIKIGAPVELVRSKDMRADLQHNTQRLTDVVEGVVRAYPQQWFWFHKRWKHAYPQLYPEYHRRRAERLARGNRKTEGIALSPNRLTSGAMSSTKEHNMAIKKELLEILACPKCKGDIHLNDAQDGLICDACRLLYEIRDDIPIMLIEEAKPLEAE